MTRSSGEIKINSLSLKEMITEEHVTETLNLIVLMLENKDNESIEALMENYKKMISITGSKLRSYFEKNNLKFTFAEFLKTAISKPLGEWLLKDNFKKKDHPFFVLTREIIYEDGYINESILEFLNGYMDRRNDEQNLIRSMISELRMHSMDSSSQEVYTLIRDNLVAKNGEFDNNLKRPKSNIWSAKDKIVFEAKLRQMKVNVKFPETYDFINKRCFEKIVGPISIELCNNCGLPLKYKGGELKCINDVTCRHNSLARTESRRVLELKEYETAFKVKEGIAYFITRVGIEETLVYEFVKKKYEPLGWTVVKYPGQDAVGDIMMTKGRITIVIDLKDFVSACKLKMEIAGNPAQYAQKDIIYIPQYRKDIYENKRELDSLKKLLASEELTSSEGRNPVLAYNDNYGQGGNLVSTINAIIAEKERKIEMESYEQCQITM